jgi:hypothetical protein
MSGRGDSPKAEGRSRFSPVPRRFLVAEARG